MRLVTLRIEVPHQELDIMLSDSQCSVKFCKNDLCCYHLLPLLEHVLQLLLPSNVLSENML